MDMDMDMDTDDPTHERIRELEIRIAYQDKLLATLDEVVVEFTRRVRAMEDELRTLRQSLPAGQDTGPADEPPPHY